MGSPGPSMGMFSVLENIRGPSLNTTDPYFLV